jgi:hypothetical protein
MKNKWNDISKLEDHEVILQKIIKLFESNFVVQKILYDDVGYLVFKIFLISITPGILHSSKELGITLNVLDVSSSVKNEMKKNCLLYDLGNELQTRVGDIIIFYISRNKGN